MATFIAVLHIFLLARCKRKINNGRHCYQWIIRASCTDVMLQKLHKYSSMLETLELRSCWYHSSFVLLLEFSILPAHIFFNFFLVLVSSALSFLTSRFFNLLWKSKQKIVTRNSEHDIAYK